jgi:hypothetical protein
MFKKTMIALLAAFALFASFDTGVKAQGNCNYDAGDAYARPRC